MAAIDKNPKLFVKSYFTSSIAEAIELAGAELGPDALLLNTRPAPPESGRVGQYEVVFGCPPATTGATATAAAPDPVADLRKRMDEIREMVSRIGTPGSAPRPSSAGDQSLSSRSRRTWRTRPWSCARGRTAGCARSTSVARTACTW